MTSSIAKRLSEIPVASSCLFIMILMVSLLSLKLGGAIRGLGTYELMGSGFSTYGLDCAAGTGDCFGPGRGSDLGY